MKSLVYGGRRGSQHKRGLLRVVQKERNCWSQPQESLLREAQHEAALLPSCNHQTPISPRQKKIKIFKCGIRWNRCLKVDVKYVKNFHLCLMSVEDHSANC
eukprot:Filipodium_phascolosomae@DN806_c0_g1_i1.p1